MTPLRFWRDRRGDRWPVAWKLETHGLFPQTIRFEALVDDQLMDLGLRYWEGIVRVAMGDRDIGRGYMELTGYGSNDGLNQPEG